MNSIDTAACMRASLFIQHFIQIQPLLINIKMNLMEFKVFYLNRVQVAVFRPMSVSQKNEEPLERIVRIICLPPILP